MTRNSHGRPFFFALLLLGWPGHAADWPQLQHDPQRTGRADVAFDPARLNNRTAKWVWVEESRVTRNFVSQANAKINYPARRTVILAGDVQPVVAQDRVYFGASNGEFYALNGADGSTLWKKQLGGPVLHTAAYDGGIVVTGCMDGKIYAFDAANGADLWTFSAEAGFNTAPLVMNAAVYMGSRDGNFYAVNLADGSLKWKYTTVAAAANDPHSGAAIVQSAASNGSAVFFGAENMYFYALSAATGAELWRKKLGGQSFQFSWPVVQNNAVMTFVMVPDGHTEFLAEAELDALPGINAGESRTAYAARVWPQERTALRNWLAANPLYRNFYVMDAMTGNSPYAQEVPMGRVGGIGYPNRAPVIDNAGRPLMYWRTKSTTFITGGTFGTKYTPDISALDLATGDRLWLPAASGLNTELDNTFMMTTAGDILFLNNHMRGSHAVNMNTGALTRMTSILARWDGGDFRGWGNKLIWWGNDTDASGTVDLPPLSQHRSPQGDAGIVIATVGGTPTLFIQESGHYQIDFGCLAAVQ